MIVACLPPGETSWKTQGRLQGDIDLPITDQGARQVEDWARDLSRLAPDAGYVDPGQSARESAEAFSRVLPLRFRDRKELRAPNLGLWQGLLIKDLKRKHPRNFRLWLDNPVEACPPEGEPFADLLHRIESFVDFLRRKRENETVIVVCQPVVGAILHGLLQQTDLRPFLSDACALAPEPWIWPAGL